MTTWLKSLLSGTLLLFVVGATFLLPVQLQFSASTAQVTPSVAFAQQPTNTSCVDWGGVNFGQCAAAFFQYVWFMPMTFIASATGWVADFFLDYSISSSTYSSASDFINRGWALVRDIVNVAFIFVLLYIAIGTILNLVDYKKLLVNVILVALLINFSLFFTKVIIDASNILARAFAGSIQINVQQESFDSVTEFSSAIVSKFELGKMLDNSATGIGSLTYQLGELSWLGDIFLFLIGGLILLYLSYVFLVVAFLFLGRVIELWFAMILAPIAFISYILPFNIPELGHSDWSKRLFSSAFLAPVFLFFMYLLIMFLDIGFINGTFSNLNNSGTGTDSAKLFITKMLMIIIPFLIVAFIIKKAKDIAEKMAGEIGTAFATAGKALAGLGAAALTGGVAMVGRGTFGALGSKLSSSTMGGKMGRMTRSLGSTLETSSFDWRHTEKGKKIMQDMGLNSFGAGNFGAKNTEGGIKGRKERYEKERADDAKLYTDNRTKAERKKLQDIEDIMTEFNDIFSETIKDLEDGVVDARTNLRDHIAKEPVKPPNNASQATKTAYQQAKAAHDAKKQQLANDLVTAQTNLSNLTDNPQAEFTQSYSDMKKSARTAKRDVATKSTQARTEYAEMVKNEYFTGQSQSTKDSLAKKIRFNRASK